MKIYDPRVRRQRDIRWIKQLIWAYFFLLIFEGVLRKWIVPQLSNPLLLIRDPFILAAYFLAWRSGVFPNNIFVKIALFIGFIAALTSLILNTETPFIAIYGFRTNFLPIPFLFLIPKVFDRRDVERVGYWTLLIAMPMAALMCLQYLASPSSFLNAGAGEGTEQITSALGRIRPAGTFSFVTGPTYFFSFVSSVLLYSQFGPRFPAWLVLGATAATMCAAAVSGSRSLVASIAIVLFFGLICSSLLRPQLAFRLLGGLVVMAVISLFLSQLSVVQLGIASFSQRVTNAAGSEGGSLGFLARFMSGYTAFFPLLSTAPLFGEGLGMGTNVGAAITADKTRVIWFENEWSRHILESGPILGGSFVLYRLFLTVWMGFIAVRHTAHHNPYAALIFGAVFMSLLNGSLGQTTSQGFIILLSGLCIAAVREPAQATRQTAPSARVLNSHSASVSASETVAA